MKDFVVKWLWVIAVGLGAAAIFYIALTVHSHNAALDCMKQGFDQVLNELLHHQTITAPPTC